VRDEWVTSAVQGAGSVAAMGLPDGASRFHRRLAEEMQDDGVVLTVDDVATAGLVVEELDCCRRAPIFEGRQPIYGSIVTRDPDSLGTWSDLAVELVHGPGNVDHVRAYADGRASYVVRNPDAPDAALLACFDRPLQYEADLVLLQESTGALVVQRTPMFGVTRLFQPGQVVAWDGRAWSSRATAHQVVPLLLDEVPDLDPEVALGVLSLAIHWLAPTRGGATLVLSDERESTSYDMSGSETPPVLNVTDRHHRPALWSCLLQRDLATLVDLDGSVHCVGVGLLAGPNDELLAASDHGMRHRSALRWSMEHPDAVVTVVSADGPVTIYRAGVPIISADGSPPAIDLAG
jgi:DNA integrity scanning protein DisA with diadenylate cyclase activity